MYSKSRNIKMRWFISEDPIGLEGGINLYLYVGNNPVNWVDPWGLKCKKPFWSRVGENFWQTNKVIPGALAPAIIPGVGMGLLTGGKVAELTGGITLRQWAMLGFRGAALQGVAFTGLETGIIAAGTAATNFALVGLAWETGVGIGSIISAAILPCEEEIEPPKPKGCK
ncbi:MAG: RHS repeat-associated core domain-containing protein [Nitrospirae bacterium]|nr:RHS repeat-associated core domain-containing protein [Nitrospirota bacterium]